jgi:hypothetical protein
MNRLKSLLMLFALGAVTALAQETRPVPIAEIGMSFSFASIHPGDGAPSLIAPGGSGTFVYNFNKVFSAVADLGGYHNASDTNFNPTTFTYLFGPRLSLRKSGFTPYVQTLFGGATQWTSFVDPATGLNAAHSGFAAAFGGGLDVRVSDHIIVKPVQVEYLMTQVTNPWSVAGTQNNLRYSAGVVLAFGSR